MPAAPALDQTPTVSAEAEKDTPPDGGAANAANPDQDQSSQEKTGHGDRGNANATASKKVPRGAAGRGEPATTEEYLRRKLSHRFVDDLLAEAQPLGVDRRMWFNVPLDRVKVLMDEAVRTHEAHRIRVPTRMRDLLDQEVRQQDLPTATATAGRYDRAAWSD